jgi:CRP-like cAMP-binding protein
MKEYYPTLSNIELFSGISLDELSRLLVCLDANVADFKKGRFIWLQGDANYYVGIVLQGKVNIIKEDIMGGRSLIAGIEAPYIFGESMVSAEVSAAPVSVQAAFDSTIMLINFKRIIKSCASSCAFHTRLVQNMMKIIALKNIYLNEKIDYLKKTTTRQKLAAYILNQMRSKNYSLITLPLNREDLADYLGVNRSALSRELSNMKSDGLIEYKKSSFSILNYAAMKELAD